MSDPRLIVVPSVPLWTDGEDVVLDRKFHDGMLMYVRSWPGRVAVLARRAAGPQPAFGTVRADRTGLPFDVTVLEPRETIAARHLAGAAVVLASADDNSQLHLGALCREVGARCVYAIEYIPETRAQINALETPNRLLRARRRLYLWRGERARRAAFAVCDGVQANGTPAFDEYGGHAASLLYFDTRMGRDAIVRDAELDTRLATLSHGRPLRLAFSGRLIAMKGADRLVRAAAGLRRRGIAFDFTVYGAGELEPSMRVEVRRLGLEDVFHLRGAVDFDSQLVPEIKANVDLYVMLHRQSDPSCTYLETLSCGIPIVGYGNRAFAGILRRADVGAAVAMNDIDGVVDAIARLDVDRDRIARMSRNAAAFARGHSFEDTFRRRIDHLLQVVGGAR